MQSEKGTVKKYEDLWSKIRDRIRSITNRSHNSKHNMSDTCDEQHKKLNFLSKKTLELHNMIAVVGSVVHEENTIRKLF